MENLGLQKKKMERISETIRKVLGSFDSEKRITLEEFERFLRLKYHAERIELKDVNRCTNRRRKVYNKKRSILAFTEGEVHDAIYRRTYRIPHENCIDPFEDKSATFRDVVVVVGSLDGEHPTHYYVGGYSEGLDEQLYVLCGKYLEGEAAETRNWFEDDYLVFPGGLPDDAAQNVFRYLCEATGHPESEARFTLDELDRFLKQKYEAVKIELPEINECTNRHIKMYNKFCNTVWCISECNVPDEDYVCTYRILQKNCINPIYDKEQGYRDVVIIVGSKDGAHPTGSFIGGYSENLGNEMSVFCEARDIKRGTPSEYGEAEDET